MARFSATVKPDDVWTVHVQSGLRYLLSVESHDGGIRVDLHGLWLHITDNRIDIYRHGVREGDYIDVSVGSIDLRQYKVPPRDVHETVS